MEIDQSKSAAEDEMEMMMMMDKFPDFYAACNDVSDLAPPPPEFPANIPSNSIPHFIDSSPPFIGLPSNLPLITNTHFHEDSPSPSPSLFLLNPTTTRWRGSGVGEFAACANDSQKKNSMAAMREMIFRMAAMQPIHIDPESVKPPKRRNVKISKDPQSVAARHRRERISERIRILQRLVPGGTKMDTASMLDEAIHYVKFLKTQVQSLERAQANRPSPPPRPPPPSAGIGFPVTMSSGSYLPAMGKAYGQQQLHPRHHNVQHYGDG